MPAYFFFDVRSIHDQNKLDEYKAGVFASVERHGGRYLVLGGPFEVLEGGWSPSIPVIIEFPDHARAQQWYESDDYAPLKALRLQATESNGVLIDGFDHQPGG
jgi:uncharacterized protein (DUF1330 family)